MNNLVVRYGRAPAVNGVSLTVDEGEVVSVVGPNGAGKTTTLAAILGARRLAGGTIEFAGTALNGSAPEDIVRMGVSLVPEGGEIFKTLSVKDNLLLGMVGRQGGRAPDDEVERELERFPILRRCLSSPAGDLSGGEQQQLAIARALLAAPRLLLLDEPSLGLAPKLVDKLFATLEGLRREGMSMLLVEQNARKAIEFADRTYVMGAGRVRLSGSRQEILDSPRVEATYLGGGVQSTR